MRILLVAGAVLSISACGVDLPLRPPPAISDPARATEVTVIRPKAFIASEYGIYITYGGQALTEISEAEYTRFRVPAGRQTIGVACSNDRNAIDADFRAGEPAYFVIRPSRKCADVEQIDAGAGARLMADARLRPLPQLSAAAAPPRAAAPAVSAPAPAVSAPAPAVSAPAPAVAAPPRPVAVAPAPAAAALATSSPCPPFSFTVDGGRTFDTEVLRRDRPELYQVLERPAVRDLFLAEWRPTLRRLGVASAEQAYAACGGIVDDAAARLSIALSKADAEELSRALASPAMDRFLAELLRMRGEPRLAPEIAARLAK